MELPGYKGMPMTNINRHYQIVSDKECIHLYFPKVWIVSRGYPIILFTLCYSDGWIKRHFLALFSISLITLILLSVCWPGSFVTHVFTSIAILLFRCLCFLCWVVGTRSEFWLFSLSVIYFASIFPLLLIFHSVYGGCGAMEFLNVYVVRSINQRLIFQ